MTAKHWIVVYLPSGKFVEIETTNRTEDLGRIWKLVTDAKKVEWIRLNDCQGCGHIFSLAAIEAIA